MNLGKKIGPLPLWAWLLIGAAGLYAGVVIRRRMQNSAGQAATGTVASPDLGSAQAGGGASSGSDGTSGIAPVDNSSYLLDAFKGGADWASQMFLLFGGSQSQSQSPYSLSGNPMSGSSGGLSPAPQGFGGLPLFGSPSGPRVTWHGSPLPEHVTPHYVAEYYAPHEVARFSSAPVPAPKIDTRLLPSGGFGRPHTVTGGF